MTTDDAIERHTRRNALHQQLDGAVLFPGHSHASRNARKNNYPFRQESHFLYYCGLAIPDQALLIMPDGETRLYGTDRTPAQIVWEGPGPSVEECATSAGIDTWRQLEQLSRDLAALIQADVPLHYLPPSRDHTCQWLATLLKRSPEHITAHASDKMASCIWAARAIKSPREVAHLEAALQVSRGMYLAAANLIGPGISERQVVGAMQGYALSCSAEPAFQPIVTVHGEVLHNHSWNNFLGSNDMLLLDTGVELPPHCYGSDITRTWPVSGVFSPSQLEIYRVVLDAQLRAIAAVRPGITMQAVHREAAMTITEGLVELGVMTGSSEDAVEQGAYRLFFPHGIGHLLGLDPHDMEDLTDILSTRHRSPSGPGISSRLSLDAGCVITIEPGIYFIPALIEQWARENRHSQFINYSVLDAYMNFGGIRIEDDILVTGTGSRVLGPLIPKTPEDIATLLGA